MYHYRKNGNKSLQDSKLKKVSSMAMKMAEMLDCEQEVASPGYVLPGYVFGMCVYTVCVIMPYLI